MLRRAARILTGLGATALGVTGGWLAYSRFVIDHDVPLPEALDAERKTFTPAQAGRLSYYADLTHDGPPLVLIHSINAGGSTFEMKPLFEHYRATRPIYALDLPGFGFSERSDRRYLPELYQVAIASFLREVVGRPADVVALSLSSEFAAASARDNGDLFRTLSLISPTGFGGSPPEEAGERLYSIFSFPLWAQGFYDLLVTPPSLRYFLGLTFTGPVPQEFIEYAYKATHQPGARYAPLYFVSGQMFNPRIVEEAYSKLDLPVLVLYGRDPDVGFDDLPALLERRSNWQAQRIGDLRLPHWEDLPATTAALGAFWAAQP